jgi:hypothetical protein
MHLSDVVLPKWVNHILELSLLHQSSQRRGVMKTLTAAIILVLSLFTASAMADEWTGWISDAKCGAKGASADHKDCALKCVKGGAKPVFVADEKVYQIDDASKVEGHVGYKVTITGSMDGKTIKVESVKPAD